MTLCLNCARRDVVQSFTGLMPPYTRMRRLGYQISQFGIHGRQIKAQPVIRLKKSPLWNATAA